MKVFVFITFLGVSTLLITSSAFAESSASVNIDNNVESSDDNVSSNTKIRVETNGNVTEYESDEPNQKIEVKAVDDKSEIKIDDQIITETATDESKKNPTQSPAEDDEVEESTDDSNIVVRFLNKIFSFLDFL